MKKILLPVDLEHGEVAESLLARGADLASGNQVEFIVLHVMDDIPPYVGSQLPEGVLEAREMDAAEKVAQMTKKAGLAGNVQVMVRRGQAQHVIVEVAAEEGVEAIVIASHKPTAADYLLGSVAASVVRHAPCSVMVIR